MAQPQRLTATSIAKPAVAVALSFATKPLDLTGQELAIWGASWHLVLAITEALRIMAAVNKFQTHIV